MSDSRGTNEGVPQPVNHGLEQPVLFDVLGELVQCDFNGKRGVEAPPDLVAELDSAPHSIERVLLPTVAL